MDTSRTIEMKPTGRRARAVEHAALVQEVLDDVIDLLDGLGVAHGVDVERHRRFGVLHEVADVFRGRAP